MLERDESRDEGRRGSTLERTSAGVGGQEASAKSTDGWMVHHIDSPFAFSLLGMAIPIATAALAWRFAVRRFLVGEDREHAAPLKAPRSG